MKNREAGARSMLLNLQRRFHLDCVSKAIEVPGLQQDDAGYFRVSYHVAGTGSAWVQQANIRREYPMLKTKVVSTVSQPCDWNAEIWVKLRTEEDV